MFCWIYLESESLALKVLLIFKISFLVELLEKKDCLGVVIRSNPPTVTLPRVKVRILIFLPLH